MLTEADTDLGLKNWSEINHQKFGHSFAKILVRDLPKFWSEINHQNFGQRLPKFWPEINHQNFGQRLPKFWPFICQKIGQRFAKNLARDYQNFSQRSITKNLARDLPNFWPEICQKIGH